MKISKLSGQERKPKLLDPDVLKDDRYLFDWSTDHPKRWQKESVFTPNHHSTKWTLEDDRLLISLWNQGVRVRLIALKTGYSRNSVISRARRLKSQRHVGAPRHCTKPK